MPKKKRDCSCDNIEKRVNKLQKRISLLEEDLLPEPIDDGYDHINPITRNLDREFIQTLRSITNPQGGGRDDALIKRVQSKFRGDKSRRNTVKQLAINPYEGRLNLDKDIDTINLYPELYSSKTYLGENIRKAQQKRVKESDEKSLALLKSLRVFSDDEIKNTVGPPSLTRQNSKKLYMKRWGGKRRKKKTKRRRKKNKRKTRRKKR